MVTVCVGVGGGDTFREAVRVHRNASSSNFTATCNSSAQCLSFLFLLLDACSTTCAASGFFFLDFCASVSVCDAI